MPSTEIGQSPSLHLCFICGPLSPVVKYLRPSCAITVKDHQSWKQDNQRH